MKTTTKQQPNPTAAAVAGTTAAAPNTGYRPDPAQVRAAIEKRSFATLATTSPAGRPHVAGVLYEVIEGNLYINTLRTSRKARNIVTNRAVAVCLPVRRLPVGPPSTIQFQSTADILPLDDPAIRHQLDAGRLASITGHGELDHPDGCFLRIKLPDRLVTYGLGMSIRSLIADPLSAGGLVPG